MKKPSLLLALLTAVVLPGCAGTAEQGSTTAAPSAPTSASTSRVHKLASRLVYEDLVVGNGTMADPGLMVSVNYAGTLADGTHVDSSADHGRPYTFQLGAAAVIAGWDQGIKGMRVGGKRKLTIPPDMAYGARGSGDRVPPNSTLIFEVELVGVK